MYDAPAMSAPLGAVVLVLERANLGPLCPPPWGRGTAKRWWGGTQYRHIAFWAGNNADVGHDFLSLGGDWQEMSVLAANYYCCFILLP